MDHSVKRLEATGMSLAQAFVQTDADLLRHPTIGRKTLRFIRSYNGPKLPVPVAYVAPKRGPQVEDYTDADGYVDWDEYEYDIDQYQQRMDYERDQIPMLGECWCGETLPVDDDYISYLHELLAQ